MTDLFQILITDYYSQSFLFCCETYLFSFFFFNHFSLQPVALSLHCQSMALTRRGGRDKNHAMTRTRNHYQDLGLEPPNRVFFFSFSFFSFNFICYCIFPVMDLLPDFWEISVGMKIFVC